MSTIILNIINIISYIVGDVNFSINIFEGSGNFEINEGGSVVVTGHISVLNDTDSEQLDAELPVVNIDNNTLYLKSEDIYKDLGLRGYDYKGVFRGVKESDSKGDKIIIFRFVCKLLISVKKNIHRLNVTI
jgi:hypothetical protein